ncbi:MAG: GMC family oxidoreductase [Woeseiaceae bacterium]
MSDKKQYDAIVVGSGATGGVAAKELAERGLETLVLEAGPKLDETMFRTEGGFKTIGSMSRVIAGIKGQHVQAGATFFSPEKSFLFVNDRQNPYTHPAGQYFAWYRGRHVGGRILSWGRVVIRMSDYDFKGASRDGVGEDWPISYDDLAPYYDHVEDFLGVVGTSDGIPNLPDGRYRKTAGLGELEQGFKRTVESRWPERKVVPWRYVMEEATPEDAATGTRTSATLAAAEATGRLKLQANAIVERIDIDPQTGNATGVTYIDAGTKQRHSVSANVVVVCASTIESIRLLLNSGCTKHPDGVGNSSGLLGKYFMDQCPSLIFGTVPGSNGWELVDGTSPANNHGGIYMPRFTNLDGVTHPDFVKGFNVQGVIGRGPVPEDHPAVYGFMGQGEMPAYQENSITLNGRRKDAWGMPVPHINVKLTDNERKLLRAEVDAIKEMSREAGYEIDFAISLLGIDKTEKFLPEAGWFEKMMFRFGYKRSMAMGAAIHECGGARMGTDPKTSVLNAHNQCWDVPNVFVTDSSCFVSNGTCGPTLTTMALTTRACEYIAQEYQGTRDIRSAA